MAGLRQCATGLSLGLSLCLMAGALASFAQRPSAGDEEGATTRQRLETEPWWPTMSSAPLEAYAGTTQCVRCHADEAGTQTLAERTAMARAAFRVEDPNFVKENSAKEFVAGALHYSLRADADGMIYKVTSGDAEVSQKLEWVMGAGDLGRTFVYQRDGRWSQSRVSEYRIRPNLDVTTGLSIPKGMGAGDDLAAALGKVLTPEEVRHCFSCHTVHATSSRGFNPAHAEAGLGCEACHGPGAGHLSIAATNRAARADLAVFNPANLSPAASIDFCGACHRTFGDVTEAANPANDDSVVRFQPYRLEKSRCWRETRDARLTCVACHDPHAPLVREDASYDRQCLRCHSAGVAAEHAGKVCPTGAKQQCVSCHMPKVKVASMHGEFTDHFIRVVRAGDTFPK